MIKEMELVLGPEAAANHEEIIKEAAKALHVPLADVNHVELLKRSIDARSRKVVFRIKIKVYIKEAPPTKLHTIINYPSVSNAKRVLIIGSGPAGMFAALKLIELGLKPVILERGKDIKERRRDLAIINKEGIVNPESNYCYGEGGAGTYSDGKLYTRSTKRGDVNSVLQLFVAHGATEDILIDARPHIGTNKLPQIIEAMRNSILNAGGEIHFNSKVIDIIVDAGKVKGAKLSDGNLFEAEALILATGHSARDIFQLLYNKGIRIEAKPFALGVRIEHPQEIIDQSQYHCDVRDPYLPPSYYNLVEQVDGRGVFSFCMCPGGIIAPCATAENEIVVNGWSPSKRNNPYANSGMVVQINLEDIPGDILKNPLAGLEYQAAIEQSAYNYGGGKLVAPAQRLVDFVNNKISKDLPDCSYIPGLKSVALNEVLPEYISSKLRKALPKFGDKMPARNGGKGYYTNEAVLVGVESRTSSPVRIPRDPNNMQHPDVIGLYPCAEGAGYAGGIVSAAIDGQLCAEAVLKQVHI